MSVFRDRGEMTVRSHRCTSLSLGALVAALALVTSACGGSQADASDTPTSAPTSVTATPTPAPTPTAEPLSPFEEKAPVKAARAFFVLVAKRLNAGDYTMSGVVRLATPEGVHNIARVYHDEIDHRAILPGPQPFTPVSVVASGGEARLSVCMRNQGWALDPKTKRPWAKSSVGPVQLVFTRKGGAWKFDRGSEGSADCDGVKVPEVKF